jgi:hypothetical protein
MRRARAIPALACTALVAMLGACSGDDGTEQLDAQELVGRGDELCREGQNRFVEIQAEPPSNAKEATDQTDELVDVERGELDELRALEPPEELRAGYEAYLNARAAALEKLEEGRDAADSRDAGAYAAAQAELSAGADKRRKLAAAVGFQVCSSAPAPAAG